MKRAKKREPYRSLITDANRRKLIQQVGSRVATNEEIEMFLSDYRRAQEKHGAALEQMAHPGEVAFARFEAPDKRASSASATMVVSLGPIEHLARDGAKARRGWRKAGLGRHSPDNDPETAARHKAWRLARDEILAEKKAADQRKPSQRGLALLICKRVPNSKAETVRGFLKLESKQQRR